MLTHTHTGEGKSHVKLQSDEYVSRKRRKKKAAEEITPSLRMKGQEGMKGGEVDGSAVKSYFSSLREPWNQAPAPGPPLKPARRKDM